MVRLLVLYGTPTDTAAFDKYYHEVHIPLANKIPGIKSYKVSHPVSADPRTPSPYYLIADIEFESQETMGAGFASPEGIAVSKDVRNFASGGVTMLVDSPQAV